MFIPLSSSDILMVNAVCAESFMFASRRMKPARLPLFSEWIWTSAGQFKSGRRSGSMSDMPIPPAEFQERSLTAPNGSILFALTDGQLGLLMYLREIGDAGFSSRNPDYVGPKDARVTFRLSNGQPDEFPAEWCYPLPVVERAIEHFVTTGKPPTFIKWHNDSGDGRPIVQREPRHGERSYRLP